MTKARFLFTFVVCGGFTFGLSHAAEPSTSPTERDTHESHLSGNRAILPLHANPGMGKSEQKEEKFSKPKEDGNLSEKGRQVEPLKPLVKRPSEKETRPPELKRPATASKEPSVIKKPAQRFVKADKMPAGSEVVAPRPGAVRTRSVPETLIGKVRVSGALDGTTIMKRRP